MTRINHGVVGATPGNTDGSSQVRLTQPGAPVHRILGSEEATLPADQVQTTHPVDFSSDGIRLDLAERRIRALEYRLADIDKAFTQMQEYAQLVARYAATSYDILDRHLHPEDITSIGDIPLRSEQDEHNADLNHLARGGKISSLDLDVEKRDAMGKPMGGIILRGPVIQTGHDTPAPVSFKNKIEEALKNPIPPSGLAMPLSRNGFPTIP